MTSRLDRLFMLLESGSSPATRKAAAQQLGEVQRLHPHELYTLLGRIHTCLQNPQWEARIAASQAIEAIVNQVPQWSPKSTETAAESCVKSQVQLKVCNVDIRGVLQRGHKLMGADISQYDVEETKGLDIRERLSRQRALINKKLGLDLAQQIGIDTTGIVCNEDLEVQSNNSEMDPMHLMEPQKDIGAVVDQEVSSSAMSSRERNRARRKARLLAKQQSRDSSTTQEPADSEDRQPAKKRKLSVLEDPFKGTDSTWQESGEWPFEIFCEQLCSDLFSPVWETRHGAAIALREVIRIHGKGAGLSGDVADNLNDVQHQEWLEDLALRLVFVLALDHFGDFISDQVVAPVREAVAQVLGSVVNLMQYQCICSLLNVLLQLLDQSNWETRHGGLLGIKYLLAVSKQHVDQILPIAYPYLYASLTDAVDDVSAVAASSLVPVASFVTQLLPSDQVSLLLGKLWDSLLDLDDVTVSTKSIMQLLASILTHTDVSNLSLNHSMVELIPRLWPFLYHSSSSVRKAVLQTLLTLFSIKDSSSWLGQIIDPGLRHIFQRALMESNYEICLLSYEVFKLMLEKTPLSFVFFGACPYIASWLCLLMTPSKVAFDPSLLILCPKHNPSKSRFGMHQQSDPEETKEDTKYFMGGNESLYSNNDRSQELTWKSRQMGSQLLGLLSCYITQDMTDIPEDTLDSYSKLLMIHLESKSAIQKQCVSLVLSEWAKHLVSRQDLRKDWPPYLINKLHESLIVQFYYDEIAVAFTRLQSETRDYLATLRHYNLPLQSDLQNCQVFTFDHIHQVVEKTSAILKSGLKIKQKVLDSLEDRRKNIQHSLSVTTNEQARLHLITQACVASAVVAGGVLPEKLNPVIRPIMDSVKTEEVELLQRHSAQCLSLLMESCINRVPCPNTKVAKNLSSYLSCDTESTPLMPSEASEQTVKSDSILFAGILTLSKQQEVTGKYSSKKGQSSKNPSKAIGNLDAVGEEVFVDAGTIQANAIERRGAELAFQCIGNHFGKELPEKLPYLWSLLTCAVSNIDVPWTIKDVASAQTLIYNLRLLETICPDLHESLHDELITHLENLILLLENPFSGVRHMASRVIASLCRVKTLETMSMVSQKVLPMLGSVSNDIQRRGAIEALHCIMETLGIRLVPYITLFIVPILGAISDPDSSVRLLSTQSFANLVRLMPLDGGIPEVPNISESLIEQKINQKNFLDQLFNINHVDDYKIPVSIKAELRKYQQHGINWLAFLNKYKLHGILCDDMGLGKTLQSICILASDHFYRKKEYQSTGNVDCYPLPSLVICPPTLVGHWVYEVERFVDPEYLKPLLYSGPPADRQRLRKHFSQYNLIVASYDIVRNDISFFGEQRWNYCILDEGHIIKNGKTKMSRAIKQLIANHRLILSGTPIQNNVLELWSLFDFLMPGYLGTERQFNARYSRPILQSRDAKTSSREQEAGALALESLHRQVLPFLLRRMKEDVLQDLPPKITQDYYCDLSSLQIKLYEDFARSRAKQTLEDTVHGEQKSQVEGAPYVFQALQYLRKVCNHPKLVLNANHSEYGKIIHDLQSQQSSLDDINHAAKLPALKQLLLDCGIGVVSDSDMPAIVVNQHRALIFCQLKSMLDIVENDLLKAHMPEVTYLRLDGSVPSSQRHSIVTRFNNDPSIDVLLLTTQVGGLGLNLTGADTVIFVEHDWNPMKDVQAMDRAHRIGQKKVVNVYRLITKGTLEEKIMGLQKFKLATANTVINQENSSLYTMGTDQLLDLFTLNDKQKSSSYHNSQDPRSKGVKAILDNLPELWDEKQYEDEYDLTTFLSNLSKK